MKQDFFKSHITINYTIKACFSTKKYTVTIQTRMKQIDNNVFLIFKGYW